LRNKRQVGAKAHHACGTKALSRFFPALAIGALTPHEQRIQVNDL